MNQTATQAATPEPADDRARRRRRRSGMVSIDVEVDVDITEHLDRVSTEDLLEELRSREDASDLSLAGPDVLLVYEYFALHGGAPPILREYLQNVTGRCLP